LELGIHLPLMEFGDEGQSLVRLTRAVDAARECAFAAVCANDHFLFQTPWLDGPTALAAVIDRSGAMDLATTVWLVALRGPVPLSPRWICCRMGESSPESVPVHRSVTTTQSAFPTRSSGSGLTKPQRSSVRSCEATRLPMPAATTRCRTRRWRRLHAEPAESRCAIGSWGSKAGLRRVARLGDGWLASAYNTSPEAFITAKESLSEQLCVRGRDPDRFPNALATMWTWITEDAREADRMLQEVLAPLLKRDADDLRGRLCIGPAGKCAELLSRYAEAGCDRVHLWPLGDEPQQIELAASTVLPAVEA
jgi:alkanesulfonate monooxygenase SsuD/methylene tetrahydromethanopterin reductase-like flavin-dependent oxidoreductase (luciferase family)